MVTDVHHLIGAQEIGRMLGVSRQRVHVLTGREDFPKPEAVLAMGKVWHTEDVKAWAAKHGRAIREDPREADHG